MKVSWRVAVAILWVCAVTSAAFGAQDQNNQRNLQSSLANVPSVKIHVTLKRKAMQIHKQSEFDVFANPVVSADKDSVLYYGFATFVEGETQFKYMFVDGTAYLVQKSSSDDEIVRCLPAVMPFDGILPALNDVTLIPSASVGDEVVECSSGNLFKTTFGGAKFAVCAFGSSGFTAFGSDMTMTVKYLDTPVSISAPTLSNGAETCSVLAAPTSVTPTALALLTGDEIPSSTSRKLKVESRMAMKADTCACKSTPRPCIFFHGLGNPTELDELQDTPKKISQKFGSIEGHAPCCSDIKYAVLNTVDTKWTDDTLQQKFCDHSLSMSSTSDSATRTIEDTIVVTHSMGGLVMAGALASGTCSFGESTSWVALSPPMTGSMAADYLQDFCNGEISSFLKAIFKVIGQCPMSISRQSTVYQGEKFSTPELDAAYVAAQEAYRGNVTAAMCSNYYVGLISTYQAPSTLAGEIVPHKSLENDGLVEFQSCAVGLDTSLFGASYMNRFYMPELNHADTAFLTGEAALNDAKKPHKWFECLF